MDCASFGELPANYFFNVALERVQLQEALYGKHQHRLKNEWKEEGMSTHKKIREKSA